MTVCKRNGRTDARTDGQTGTQTGPVTGQNQYDTLTLKKLGA